MAISQHVLPGVKVSVNISNLRVENENMCQPDTKGNFGVYLKYYINNSIFINPEIQYSGQGFYTQDYDVIVTHPGPNITYFRSYIKREDYYLHYLKAPLYIGFEPFHNGLSFHLGFYAAYLVKARLKTNEDLVDQTLDISSEFNRFDFGYAIGLRFELKNGFNYNMSMEYGINSALKGSDPKEININYTVGVGYTIGKGKKADTGK